uniref:Uncharacterized protein n=1 Tax=Corvus moneduloides TaxID=1196302 RepID=A0A8U7NTR4_CORMO
QPPWTPPVLWDQVTLTCQDRLVLQVPARALLEGDTMTLRCQTRKDTSVTGVRFYQDEKDLGRTFKSAELSLSPLQLHHSGRYRSGTPISQQPQTTSQGLGVTVPPPISFPELFPVPVLEGLPKPTEGSPLNLSSPLLHLFYRDGRLVGGPQGSPQLLLPAVGVSHSGNYSCQVRSERGAVRKSSARLRVTVRRVPLSGVSVSAEPPGGQVALGDRLVLSCVVATGTGPLSFSWHRGDSWAPLGTSPHLELRHVGDNDSGHYQCRASANPICVPAVPVASATISPGALAQPLRAGDPVTLRCSVQVGSAPVTFTWLHNGSEVARGPLLELGDVHVGHSGTYQCMATNQLGQDGHRVFRALSPELALTVTPRGHWDTGGLTRGHRGDCSIPGMAGDPDVSPSVPSSGCRGCRVPPLPAPACGCHCGLAPVAAPGWVTMGPTEAVGSWEDT